MKRTHILLCALAAVAVYLLTPPETKAALGESWLRITGNPGQLCFDYERAKLNDPITAKLRTQHVSATDVNDVTITMQAKNPFGAYTSTEVSCTIKDGKVDTDATVAKRKGLVAKAAYQRDMKLMDDGIKCLKDKIVRRGGGEVVISALPCPGEREGLAD